MAQRFNWRMMGTAIGSPTFIVPCANSTEPARPRSMVPVTCSTSRIASVGQLSVQLPQPWHSSGKMSTFSPTTAMAWYWHTSAQRPQVVHLPKSTWGMSTPTWRRSAMVGRRKSAAFGSSTSQSRKSGRSSARLSARLTATVVLPVPPLPLATVTITTTPISSSASPTMPCPATALGAASSYHCTHRQPICNR